MPDEAAVGLAALTTKPRISAASVPLTPRISASRNWISSMPASRQSPTPGRTSRAPRLSSPPRGHTCGSGRGRRVAPARRRRCSLDVRAGGAHTLRRQVEHGAHPRCSAQSGPFGRAASFGVYKYGHRTPARRPSPAGAGGKRTPHTEPPRVGTAAAREPRTACRPPPSRQASLWAVAGAGFAQGRACAGALRRGCGGESRGDGVAPTSSRPRSRDPCRSDGRSDPPRS